MRTEMSVGVSDQGLSVSDWSTINQALEVLNTPWDCAVSFCFGLSGLLKVVVGAGATRIGCSDLVLGERKTVLAEGGLDPHREALALLDQTLTSCTKLPLKWDRAKPVERGFLVDTNRWDQESPYGALNKVLPLGSDLGALIAVWQPPILIDLFIAPADGAKFLVHQRERLNVLMPHLAEICRRVWARTSAPTSTSAPSTEELCRRIQQKGVSAREAEVLSWVLQGKSNHEIALIMDISVQTVKNHLGSAYPKLGVENRTSAITNFLTSL
jgi:DNA-binding CsgD family transcriptional regulator